MSIINHFKIAIISTKSGVAWAMRNPIQKSFIVLVGEAVAIPPTNKDIGIEITLNPRLIITNDNLLLVIFGNTADQNKIPATNKIKIPQIPQPIKYPKITTS